MRKICLAIILVFILQVVVSAQEPIYLPIITKDYCMPGKIVADNGWRLIKPVASTNYVLNPSAETTGNFADIGGATTTRSTTYQKFGLYSYYVDVAAANDGTRLTLSALTNTEHFVTVRVRKPNPTLSATINATTKQLRYIEKVNETWDLYGIEFSASEANGATALDITVGSAIDFYFDGAQVEPLPYWTTYIDGTQLGCEWNGAKHASTSTRSGLSRAGGRPLDFYNEYGFLIQKVVGAGAASVNLTTDSYAILPGGELNSKKIESRDWSIVGKFIADTEPELHDNMEQLRLDLSGDAYPSTQKTGRIRFNGSKVQKEIEAEYRGGLEGNLPAYYDCYEVDDNNWRQVYKWQTNAAIQLHSPDPFWYEIGNSAEVLDAADSATSTVIVGRLQDTGRWSNLGPPDALGAYTQVNDLKWGIAGDALYIGGEFSNWDNIAAADNIVKYSPWDGTYSALAGTSLGSRVYALEFLADGTLIAGGSFQNAGGDADADWIAQHNGVDWSAISATVLNNNVLALALAPDGKLYLGGEFTNVGGDADADYVVYWDGTNFNTMGATPLNGVVRTIAVDKTGVVYLGGSFTNAGGDANADYVCKWDGTSFSALTDTPLNDVVRALAIGTDGTTLYIGGDFTDAGGDSNADYICQYNGQEFSSLGSGVDDDVHAIGIGYDGIVWVSGKFDNAGGVAAFRNAKWNGSTWTPLEIYSSGAINALTIEFGRQDPIQSSDYDVFWGFDDTGITITYAGAATVTNDGSVDGIPKIYITRSGGTSSILKFIRNETIQKALNFNDYGILDGETLTIDLDPRVQSVTSDVFGTVPALLGNSDMGSFAIIPNDNNITMFANNSGAPTITAWMEWRTAYDGY